MQNKYSSYRILIGGDFNQTYANMKDKAKEA